MEIWHALTDQVDKKEVQDSIKAINDDLYSKPVTSLRFLITSSAPGEIGAGINLYTYLKALPIEVHTFAFGEVDAAAALVFLAGERRAAVSGCQFYFREGRYTIVDHTAPVHVHEEAVAAFKRELLAMVHIISTETGNDGESVAGMLRRSKIMHAAEAQEFGLSHQTIATLPLYQQQKFGFEPK